MGSRHTGVVDITHLFFVDNTFFFVGLSLAFRLPCALFLCFEAIFGLKIKLELVLVSNWIMWMGWQAFWAAWFLFCL